MSKKILLLYGDVGAGHRSAARALQQAFNQRYPDYTIVNQDLYQIADPAPWGDSNASFSYVAQTPLLRWLNYSFNVLTDSGLGHFLLRRLILWRTLEPYRQYIAAQNADIIVSLHPYTHITLAQLKRQGISTPLVFVTTDLVSLLKGWLEPDADLYIAPTPAVRARLEKAAIPSHKIVAPLFPLQPALADYQARDTVLAQHGLDTQQQTLLVTGGGVGTGALREAIAALVAECDEQIIVICGKDVALKEELEQRYPQQRVVILGFVQRMQDYLQAADVLIIKAGPAAILEADLFAKPTIITYEIGSQEKGNAAFALENSNFHFLQGDMRRLVPTVRQCLANRSDQASRRHFDEALQICDHIATLE